MKSIRWLFIAAVALLACVLTHADEPDPPAPPGADAGAAITVTRMYPVGDLIHGLPDGSFGPGVCPATQFRFGELMNRMVQLGGGWGLPMSPRSAAPALDLAALIKDEVARGWGDGVLRFYGDLLVVRNTPENQRQVELFLQRLREHREASRPVTVQADWLAIQPGQLSPILRPARPGTTTSEVDPLALSKLGTDAFYARGRISCMGGQTVQLLSGRIRTQVGGFEECVGTGASSFQPEVGEELSGAALQVTPHIFEHVATVDVISLVSAWGDSGKPYRTGARNVAIISRPSAQTRVRDSDDGGSIDRLNAPGQQLCTTVHLTLGKPMLIGGMTFDPDMNHASVEKARGEDSRQIYLVLRVDAQ
jgi:hypothetical protein